LPQFFQSFLSFRLCVPGSVETIFFSPFFGKIHEFSFLQKFPRKSQNSSIFAKLIHFFAKTTNFSKLHRELLSDTFSRKLSGNLIFSQSLSKSCKIFHKTGPFISHVADESCRFSIKLKEKSSL
jgi:hypothetical protein